MERNLASAFYHRCPIFVVEKILVQAITHKKIMYDLRLKKNHALESCPPPSTLKKSNGPTLMLFMLA